MAAINPIQVQKALGGMNYPPVKRTSKHAEKKGAAEKVLSALKDLPNRKHKTPADVS
jgi:hypothetical protein